jgi:iron-sulfur cluster assembly accessory protein
MDDRTLHVETTHSEPGAAAPVRLTDTAMEMLKATMDRMGATGQALRVGVVGGGCSGFQYDLSFEPSAREDDIVTEQGGVRIVVDPLSEPHLRGILIDWVSGLHGAGFKFLNPNAQRTCGCGTSFAT